MKDLIKTVALVVAKDVDIGANNESTDRKAAAYVERLRVRGYMGEIVKVTA